ncbi:Universal stress protein family [Carex littledalei]|uniref:Universal stress protein family n=1 Tax=Carex littledalei TaxID=544730 RepID=A0A833VJI9_9POAL|nr:Universal stress protein family [Carex littledalei]
MESQRVVVVVEEAEASKAALQWAVQNYIRCEDSITLLCIYPFVRSRNKRRNLRLKAFQLALSFKDLCNGIAEAKVEIVVTEGEQGDSVISTVNKIGATTLVLGLHDASFLYRVTNPYMNRRNLRCRIIAVKQHPAVQDVPLLNLELSQVETIQIRAPETKIPFPNFTIPLGAICGKSKKRNKEVHKRRRYILL